MAFSRDTDAECHYVQDALLRAKADVLRLGSLAMLSLMNDPHRLMLQDSACLYVCGSGTTMGAGVDAALDAMLGETGKTAQDIKDIKKSWHEQKRYIKEVWA